MHWAPVHFFLLCTLVSTHNFHLNNSLSISSFWFNLSISSYHLSRSFKRRRWVHTYIACVTKAQRRREAVEGNQRRGVVGARLQCAVTLPTGTKKRTGKVYWRRGRFKRKPFSEPPGLPPKPPTLTLTLSSLPPATVPSPPTPSLPLS